MCAICHQSPCHPRCPNFDPSPWICGTCVDCGEPIMDGDEYIVTDKGTMHWDCFTDLGYREMVERLGGEVKTASVDMS